MDWSQVLTIVGTNLALFIWARTEASADRRQFQDQAAADRRDMLQISKDIQAEMKDFHARLYALEKERSR